MSRQNLTIKLVSPVFDIKQKQKNISFWQPKKQHEQQLPYLSIRPHYYHLAITSPRLPAETCVFRHLPIYLIRDSSQLKIKV